MAASVPNQEGLQALGRQIDQDARRGGGRGRSGGGRSGGGHRRSRSRGRTRRHRRLRRTLLVLGLVVLLVVGAGAGYGWYLDHEVHRVTVGGLTAGPTTGADAGTENILMVGSTTRCGLKKQTAAYGLCTEGVTGVNSDVIMLLHLDPATGTVRLLSLPRDLFVPNARKTGTGYGAYKVDAALYQGPTQLVAAVEEDFGIPVQHYVELNFDTFAAVVTALGGITMAFPEPVHDAYSGLNVTATGCHHLDGVEALQVVRARHLQYLPPTMTADTPVTTWPYDPQSDLSRIRRDHEFLRVLASAVATRGLGNPATDLSLVNAVAGDLTVDSGMTVPHMVNLVLTYHSVSVDKAPQWTLPVIEGTFGQYYYKGFGKGTVEFPTEPDDQAIVDKFLGIGDDTDSLTGAALPSPQSVTVSVLNGTGAATQATDTSQALGALGFRTVGTGTTAPVGQESETLVTYAHRTPTDEAAAQLVARSLSGAVIMAYGPTTDGAEVTVTTGTDFSVDPAAPAPAPATGKATTTTTTTAPSAAATTASAATPGGGSTGAATTTPSASASTANFTAPTPSSTPLKPWDPRACPAGAKGTTSGWGS